MVSRVLEKTGTSVRDRKMIFKEFLQTVLFYGRESWVITGSMMKVLEAFHHYIVRRLTGKTSRNVRE